MCHSKRIKSSKRFRYMKDTTNENLHYETLEENKLFNKIVTHYKLPYICVNICVYSLFKNK